MTSVIGFSVHGRSVDHPTPLRSPKRRRTPSCFRQQEEAQIAQPVSMTPLWTSQYVIEGPKADTERLADHRLAIKSIFCSEDIP
jgi:hypothetical protein